MVNDAAENVKALAGLVLIAAGGLLLALSGTCTVFGVFFGMLGLAAGDLSALGLVLMIGGVPMLAGYVMLRVGLSLWRGQAPRRAPPSKLTEHND
jgi:hypothetical protein